jgi:TRAP-type C4-dicarboxylate transport system permease small subunit
VTDSDTGGFGRPAIEQLHDRYGGRMDRTLRRMNGILHAAAGVTMVLLMLWTVGDIAGRSLFSTPFRGTVELTELAVVILVYLGLARAEDQDAHIAVDLLFVRLEKEGQLAMRVFAGAVSVLVIGIMTWRLFVFAQQLNAGGQTTGVLRIPLYPVALIGVAGSAAFGLAALSNMLVSLRALVRRRNSAGTS